MFNGFFRDIVMEGFFVVDVMTSWLGFLSAIRPLITELMGKSVHCQNLVLIYSSSKMLGVRGCCVLMFMLMLKLR